ncbi:MAG: SxtJ family membrane protein [Vicinamibacterales bacterium]
MHFEERQFGRVVGGVLFALGTWALWRSAWPFGVGAAVAGTGMTLVTLSVVYPAALVRPRRAWMLLAEGLSFVSTRIILGVVFFLVMVPLGFVMRATGWDPLARKANGRDSHWVDYPERHRNPKYFEQMY